MYSTENMSFFAWYPYEADSLDNFNTYIDYTIPDDVTKQQDLMVATANYDPKSGSEVIPLTFNHALTAVKFVMGDLPPRCVVNSITLKNVKYKARYEYDYICYWKYDEETKDFTLKSNKVRDMYTHPTDTVLTADNETFFMLPQSFGDDARIEIVLTCGIIESLQQGPYTLSLKLKDITSSWEQGRTYIYRISSNILSAAMTFYRSKNYTSHNISANGDIYYQTLNYSKGLKNMVGQFAYEIQDDAGATVYEPIGYLSYYSPDVNKGANTGSVGTSPEMNNKGKFSSQAKKSPTPVVFRLRISSTKRFVIFSTNDPDTRQIFDPETDAGKWYIIWRGVMYPPNYVLTAGNVSNYISRANLNNSEFGTYATLAASAKEYWEVDPEHPIYGKGKWALSDLDMFTDEASTFSDLTFEMQKYIYNAASPGENELYGEPFIKNAYWSDGVNGIYNNVNYIWIFLGSNDTNKFPSWVWAQYNAPMTKRWDYPMTSVDENNGGVKGRGWVKYVKE